MRRYLIFLLLGPSIGGLLLLLTGAYVSGHLNPVTLAGVGKVGWLWLTTIHYIYLFGFIPVLIIAAVDDILHYVRTIGPVLQMLLTGAAAFLMAGLLYASRGADNGAAQFILYGLAGTIPAMISSWWSSHVYRHETAAMIAKPAVKSPS